MSHGGRRRRRWAVPAVISLLVLSAGLAGCGGQPDAHVVVDVTPRATLNDQPVDVTVRGLSPHQLTTLSLSATDANNFDWDGHAEFKANSHGVISLDQASAISGDYRGVHGMGLLAGLQPARASKTDGLFYWDLAHPIPFTLTVTADNKVVAHATFQRRAQSHGVTATDEYLPGHGFYGQMSWPKRGATRHAAVLEFDGSDGGLTGQLQATDLASAGYPTLDLAYFKEPGLPSTLTKIPLSYFVKALRWLARQPGVNPRRIWVMGTSRGGEAAFLLAAHYPELVYGVVANVSADVSLCSFPGCHGPAWTYHGKPVPYHPKVPDAFLPAPSIRGPVLLDCGTDDREWGVLDGCGMAAYNMTRLARDPSPHQLYRFVGGGHGLGAIIPYEPDVAGLYVRDHLAGVNPIADSNADAVLWPRLLAFLAHPAKTGTYSVDVG